MINRFWFTYKLNRKYFENKLIVLVKHVLLFLGTFFLFCGNKNTVFALFDLVLKHEREFALTHTYTSMNENKTYECYTQKAEKCEWNEVEQAQNIALHSTQPFHWISNCIELKSVECTLEIDIRAHTSSNCWIKCTL